MSTINNKLWTTARFANSRYFKKQIKEQLENPDRSEDFQVTGKAWVTTIDVDVRTDQIARAETEKKMLAFWSNEENEWQHGTQPNWSLP